MSYEYQNKKQHRISMKIRTSLTILIMAVCIIFTGCKKELTKTNVSNQIIEKNTAENKTNDFKEQNASTKTDGFENNIRIGNFTWTSSEQTVADFRDTTGYHAIDYYIVDEDNTQTTAEFYFSTTQNYTYYEIFITAECSLDDKETNEVVLQDFRITKIQILPYSSVFSTQENPSLNFTDFEVGDIDIDTSIDNVVNILGGFDDDDNFETNELYLHAFTQYYWLYKNMRITVQFSHENDDSIMSCVCIELLD